MTPPQVSIITPAHNAAAFIDDAIASVVAQTFEAWELLVVDDCSTDATVSVVEDWVGRDPRIHLLTNRINRGPGPTRNRAMKQAVGRFVAFLDADDLWQPEKLQVQIESMKRTGSYFTFTSYEIADGLDGRTKRVVSAPERVGYHDLLKNTNIGCLTVVIDRSQVDRLSMPDLPSRQPLVLWLRLLKRFGPARGIDRVLARYRARPVSVSSDKLRAMRNTWRVYREYEDLPFPYAAWCFLNYAVHGALRNWGLWRRP